MWAVGLPPYNWWLLFLHQQVWLILRKWTHKQVIAGPEGLAPEWVRFVDSGELKLQRK